MDSKGFAARDDWAAKSVIETEMSEDLKMQYLRLTLKDAVEAMNELYERAGPA